MPPDLRLSSVCILFLPPGPQVNYRRHIRGNLTALTPSRLSLVEYRGEEGMEPGGKGLA
jgi:hypothetical protein